MSGSGFVNQSAFNDGAAPTRYGGIVDITELFRSKHIQAVSVRVLSDVPDQFGVFHSAGQPDQADGRMMGGVHGGAEAPVTATPCGSPGAAEGGPTVAGGTDAGSLEFGISGSGGRIARVKSPTYQQL
jgi:hypothetical protein